MAPNQCLSMVEVLEQDNFGLEWDSSYGHPARGHGKTFHGYFMLIRNDEHKVVSVPEANCMHSYCSSNSVTLNVSGFLYFYFIL